MQKYDLEKRLIIFSQNVIKFCKSVRQDNISKPIIYQIVKSSTSIGANYCEANNACSKKDFKNKIYISKKETQETKYWLVLLSTCFPDEKLNLRKLYKECHQLLMIFQKIISTMKNNDNRKLD